MRTTRLFQLAMLTLACLALLVPCQANADTWWDNFDDGDFTIEPVWDYWDNSDATASGEVIGEEQYVRLRREAYAEHVGWATLSTSVQLPITRSTNISFDVNPVYSNIPGGAGQDDSYYPVEVKLSLLGAGGGYLWLRFCYNYRGGSDDIGSSHIRLAFPDCEQSVWLRGQTFRIRDYFPQAVLLKSVELAGRGWDFEGYVDNVRLFDVLPSHAEDLPFHVTGFDTFSISITEPQEGTVYSPCAPETVRWDSDIPAWPDPWNSLHLEWRRRGGPWHWLGLSDIDGPSFWSSPPCDPGYYQVRVRHEGAPELADTVTFYVQPPPPGDPDLCVCVDFSGDAQDVFEVEHRIDPPPYTTVSAYIGVSRLDGEPEGLTSISFRLSDLTANCPGVVGTQSFTNLLPGNLAIGDPFDSTGVTMASIDCVTVPYREVVYVGRVDLLYLGGACDLRILDHSWFPRWVVDCQDPSGISPYCVWSHGGIGRDPLGGDQECFPNTAVEAMSWGAIKAMYR